jgi:uncharacterized YccA/Bax inhibitor family protein
MSSPLFSEKAFASSRTASYEGEMTVSGTVNKTIALFIMMIIPAAFLWMKYGIEGGEGEAGLAYAFNNGLSGYMFGGMIVGFIASLVMMFKQSWAPYLAPCFWVQFLWCSTPCTMAL